MTKSEAQTIEIRRQNTGLQPHSPEAACHVHRFEKQLLAEALSAMLGQYPHYDRDVAHFVWGLTVTHPTKRSRE
jgi:hypothetical protein